jgi:hypothetical protein
MKCHIAGCDSVMEVLFLKYGYSSKYKGGAAEISINL